MTLYELRLQINHEVRWVSPGDFGKVQFYVHSANNFPSFSLEEGSIEIYPDSEYLLEYSQLSIEQLGKGYDTDCRVYDLDYKTGKLNTRSDCLLNCYTNKLHDIFRDQGKNITGYFTSELMMRKAHFDPDKTTNKTLVHLQIADDEWQIISSVMGAYNTRIKIKCLETCRANCHTQMYPVSVNKIGNFSKKRQIGSSTALPIRHNSLPDIHIKHLPEISFIEFICSFGGLIGMWLGLSVWAIFDDIQEHLNSVLAKLITKLKLKILIFNRTAHMTNINFQTIICPFKSRRVQNKQTECTK